MPLGSEGTLAKAIDEPDMTDRVGSSILPSRSKAASERTDGPQTAAAKTWAASVNLKCLVCNEREENWRSLWKHMRSHNPTPEHPEIFQDCRLPNGFFQCLVCGHQVRHMWQLQQHHYCHITDRPFECNICQKRYKTSEYFLAHFAHTHGCEGTTYRCDKCKYSADHKYLLQTHIRKVHSGTERCEVCFKQIRRNRIKEHYFLHTGETRFECEICGKKFIYHHALKNHMRSRHIKQAHECIVCGKILKYSQSLVRHMKMCHTGEASLVCCICAKSFYANSEYVRHVVRFHVRERNEKCTVCGKGFLCKYDLQKHAVVHTRERPFPCDVCGVRFSTKSRVRDHMRSHSEERPCRCHLCGAAFKRMYSLARHRRAKHA